MQWEPDAAADLVRAEGRRLIERCAESPAATIEACPGWTASDLATHTASVHRRVAHWCATRAERPEPPPGPAAPDEPTALWDWCREALELVADALAGIGPDEPVWTWTDRRDGGFYHRRMVHETVLHRWDAEAATSGPSPLDPLTSADGIDELMSVGMRFRSDGSAIPYPAGSISFLAVDTGNRWSLAAVDGVLGIGRDDLVITSTDATVTGDAGAILLALWGRGTEAVEVRGDRDVASEWFGVAP